MIDLEYGRRRLSLNLDPARVIAHLRGPLESVDPLVAIRNALNHPFEYPPLRRALTPDDHLALIVDVRHPKLEPLLVALLDNLLEAGVAPEGISLIGAESGVSNDWVDFLPERLEDAHVEEHDTKDRKRLAYLATTKAGHRLYLNRTLVEADLAIVLTMRRYRSEGYSGAELSLFPALGEESASERIEAREAAWLLGQPFYVQVIPGSGDDVAEILAGAGESLREGERRLDAAWKWSVPRMADCVVVSISGDPARHTFEDFANAAAQAAQVVVPGGRIILVSEAVPRLDGIADVLLKAEDAQQAIHSLTRKAAATNESALAWARAADRAHLTLLSGLSSELVEDLFATPLENEQQIHRLLSQGGECIILQDGHRARVELL